MRKRNTEKQTVFKTENIDPLNLFTKIRKEQEKQEIFLKDLEKQEDELITLIDMVKKWYLEQEKNLRDLKEDVNNAVNEVEKEIITMKVMSNFSKKTMAMMMIPVAIKPIRKLGAVAMAAVLTTMAMFEMVRTENETKIETVFEVEDLTTDIIAAIYDMKEIGSNLEKGIHMTEDILKDVKVRFKDQSHTKEYRSLIDNLEDMYDVLRKKEEEFHNILKEQEENLKTNKDQLKLIKK